MLDLEADFVLDFLVFDFLVLVVQDLVPFTAKTVVERGMSSVVKDPSLAGQFVMVAAQLVTV